MMLDQSSFLDKKLMASLNNSSRVQSQLKLSLQSNKSNLMVNRRNQASQEEQEHNRTVQDHIQLCMKLFDEPKIANTLRSFLALDVFQVLNSSYKSRKKTSKAPKTPPVQASSKLRIFQDELLYQSSKLDDEDQFANVEDIQDLQLLQQEIAELTEQHNKLAHDNQVGTYFLNDDNCALVLRYQYLASKLQFARYCAHTNKNQGMAGNYLSKLLDLRSLLFSKASSQVESMDASISRAKGVRQALQQELVDFMHSLHEIDVDLRTTQEEPAAVEIISNTSEKTSSKSNGTPKTFTTEEKMQQFDTHLLKINQSLKPPEALIAAANVKVSPTRKNRDRHAVVAVSEEVKEMLEGDMKPLRESAVRATTANLRQFTKEVEARMENCYQMTVRSMKKREANRQMIANGVRVNNQSPNQFAARLEDSIEAIEKREAMLSSAVQHRDAARGRIIEKHVEEFKRPEMLVTQKRVQFLNKLKAEYNSLYPETQSKTGRRRASFASPSKQS